MTIDAPRRGPWAAGLAAGTAHAVAVTCFGLALDGYSQTMHPVGLLGADDMPRAAAFNGLGYVLPGAVAAALAWRLREALPGATGLAARLGWRLAFLSALAFAAQGLLPLDPGDLDARPSRLHAVAWSLWWVAYIPAAALLAWSAWRGPSRRIAAGLAHAAAAALVLFFATPLAGSIGVAIAQRLAHAVWFGWLAWAGWAAAHDGGVSRGAASGPGSSPPARR
jgi:hypothetical protein